MTIESTSDKLRGETRGRTVLVTIDNPPANTWDRDNLAALTDLVDQCERDADVYAIVVTGAGTRFFSAGADLKVFAEGGKAVAKEMAAAFGRAFERLADYRGVTIAAINGYAMGGGLECAMACDIRIAESQAAMALPEASVGLLPCGGGTQNLAWLVGEGWAKRMILCGERVAADTAARIGLVEEVVAQGGALDAALALAERVSGQAPPAVASCKRLIQRGRSSSIAGSYQPERDAFVDLFDTADQQEGVSAFLEKRPPRWING